MTSLAAWLHTIDPVIFRISDSLAVYWYGLSYAFGFLGAWGLLQILGKRGITPMSPQRITDVMLMLIAGVIIGGRLGYVLIYKPALLTEFDTSFPFWGVLAINKGGMASHGGMAGVIVASWFAARGPKGPSGDFPERVPFLHIVDLAGLICTPGLFMGRIANFINGELLGKIVAMPGEPAPRWAVKFPQELLSEHQPELTPAQELALKNILARHQLPGDDADAALARVMDVLHRGGEQGSALAAEVAPLVSARWPSQLLQALCEGLVVGVLLVLIWMKPRRPGVIGCWFLITYGVLRVATEFVRLPDAHLAVQRIAGLSRGQWLSVAMVLTGSVALWIITRTPNMRAMGGWRRPPAAPAA